MKKFVNLIILVTIIFVFLTPIIVIFSNSYMSSNELSMNYNTLPTLFSGENSYSYMKLSLIPREFTLSHYINNLFFFPPFLSLLGNSLKLLVPILVFNIIISLLTAYGFYIWNFKHKYIVFSIYIIIMLLPIQATIVPNYIVAQQLGILNTHLAIILPGVFSPFGAFLLTQYLKAMPYDYIEAAKIDGANNFRILWSIILPQIKSAVTALAILLFIDNWNLVEQVVILIQDFKKEPLSVFLSRISEYDKGMILSASCIYMIIPIWIVIYFQKDLREGIELSGIK